MAVSVDTLTRVRVAAVRVTREYAVFVVGTEDPHEAKVRHAQLGDVLVYLIQHDGRARNYNKEVVERTIRVCETAH